MIYFYIAIAVLLLLGIPFLIWQNTTFVVTKESYSHSKVPQEMDGLRLLHVSDLHNQSFGKGNRRLLEAIKDAKPQAILITGDLIDSSFTDTRKGLDFVAQAVKIAPVYYVTGNHEHRLSQEDLTAFLQGLEDRGATLLLDRTVDFYGGTLVGLLEPSGRKAESLPRILEENAVEGFTLLMSHKPHFFDNYLQADLILSGHAHGGQVRLPWIGGLIAPGQGFFPQYTEGFYEKNGATMLVSRGCGNSHRFPRLFNRPELILLEFHRS